MVGIEFASGVRQRPVGTVLVEAGDIFSRTALFVVKLTQTGGHLSDQCGRRPNDCNICRQTLL